MSGEPPTYRFGPYELRSRTRELYKHGVKLKLRPQSYRVLQVLVERAGDMVTREELAKVLWPEQAFVDFEHGLNNSIKDLRRVLSDSANEPRIIETLPRLGYRIIVPVSAAEAATAPDSAVPPKDGADREAIEEQAGEASRFSWRISAWRWPQFAALMILAVLAVAGYAKWRGSHFRTSRPSGHVMLAVLPFENLTGDPNQEYFSDGLTEEMITQLGRVDPEKLGLIARTSVMHYKQSRERLDQIGRELGVQYVLEGSFRREADRVRVNAELIEVKGQTHLWGREYDRDATSLLSLQAEIAAETADEIHVALGGSKQAAAPVKTSMTPEQFEAYDLYLKGMYFWSRRSAATDLLQGADYFQQAIGKDPNSAPAYAALANSYALIGGYSDIPQGDLISKARAAALRALQIDEKLPEAHAALALIVQNYDWDWQTAEKEYKRAIELNPNYATAHHWYAEHLGLRGRFQEALAESERARQLDPLSLIVAADKGALLYYSRQYDRSIEQFRAVLEMDPGLPRAGMVVYAYVQKGRYQDALDLLEARRRAFGEASWYWGQAALIYGRSGQRKKARYALAQLERLSRQRQLDPDMRLLAHLGMGDRDESLAWLDKACAQHSNMVTTMRVEPAFDFLRGDPRFQKMLERVRLDR
ncbi:MAG TPA: winged helix-turn-helix domain-containing protein [Candidatus Limnocylindrales bacterium]|nr:winged helix-turn-helix domain-containing protein [Candidatus Limnocylindrales bacterium]